MNLLDENFDRLQREQLRAWRVRGRQIGYDTGRPRMLEYDSLTLLHSLRRVTLFSLDRDFSDPWLCHPAYCLVYLYVDDNLAAEYVRRVLRHPELNTQAKRMGALVRASYSGVRVW